MPNISAQKRRAALLRGFEGSGLSMAEFCRRRKIGYSTMAAWRKAAGRREAAPPFVEVEAVAVPPSVRDCPGAARGEGLPGHAGAVLAEVVGMVSFTRGYRSAPNTQPSEELPLFEHVNPAGVVVPQ